MRRGGFSLIEISVVLIVVSVMISGILPYISESQKTNAANDTMDRIEAIETAMLTYRAANGFIPCPSNIQATLNSAAFGTADATASCAAATNFTDANTAAGGVPTKTLGLPDEMGFDGWGRRMVYHVAKALTTSGGYGAGVGSITVNDAAGTARTSAAAYAIVSHGPNGHGAYTRAGGTARFSFGSTNTSEQENCECNATATATAYDSILAQFMATPNSNPLAAYDDIVRYTLKPNLELLVGGGGGGGYWTAGTGGNINDIYNANSGNVGIGTPAPEAWLQVGPSTARFFTLGDSGGSSGPYGMSLVGNGVIDQGVTPHTLKKSSTYAHGVSAINMDHYGDIYMQGYNSGSAGVSSAAWSPQFTLKASGNVGIGITTPAYKLHVVESSANPAIYARTTGANYAIYGIAGPGYGGMLGYSNSLTSYGILGYDGGSGFGGYFVGPYTGDYAYNTGSGCYNYGAYSSYGSYTNCNSYTAGTVYYGSLTAISDGRLKENVEALVTPLDKVLALRPVSYTWKKEADQAKADPGTHLGLVAQEVKSVLPELVRETKGLAAPKLVTPHLPPSGVNGAPEKAQGSEAVAHESLNQKLETVFSVDYVELVPLVIGAVKELNAKVEALGGSSSVHAPASAAVVQAEPAWKAHKRADRRIDGQTIFNGLMVSAFSALVVYTRATRRTP